MAPGGPLTASTDKSSEHCGPSLHQLIHHEQCGPRWAPHLVSALVLCLLLYSSMNYALLRAPQGPVPVQATKKSGKLQIAILVCSNSTFNPCGDITTSYLLCLVPRHLLSPLFYHCLTTSKYILKPGSEINLLHSNQMAAQSTHSKLAAGGCSSCNQTP